MIRSGRQRGRPPCRRSCCSPTPCCPPPRCCPRSGCSRTRSASSRPRRPRSLERAAAATRSSSTAGATSRRSAASPDCCARRASTCPVHRCRHRGRARRRQRATGASTTSSSTPPARPRSTRGCGSPSGGSRRTPTTARRDEIRSGDVSDRRGDLHRQARAAARSTSRSRSSSSSSSSPSTPAGCSPAPSCCRRSGATTTSAARAPSTCTYAGSAPSSARSTSRSSAPCATSATASSPRRRASRSPSARAGSRARRLTAASRPPAGGAAGRRMTSGGPMAAPRRQWEVLRRLEDSDVADVSLLVEQVTEADGVRPLSEHVMLHLRYGGDADVRHVLAGGRLVARGVRPHGRHRRGRRTERRAGRGTRRTGGTGVGHALVERLARGEPGRPAAPVGARRRSPARRRWRVVARLPAPLAHAVADAPLPLRRRCRTPVVARRACRLRRSCPGSTTRTLGRRSTPRPSPITPTGRAGRCTTCTCGWPSRGSTRRASSSPSAADGDRWSGSTGRRSMAPTPTPGTVDGEVYVVGVDTRARGGHGHGPRPLLTPGSGSTSATGGARPRMPVRRAPRTPAPRGCTSDARLRADEHGRRSPSYTSLGFTRWDVDVASTARRDPCTSARA